MISRYLKAYHPMVHVVMLGTLFISLTSAMSLIYLPIYLMNQAQLNPVTIGVIVGAGPLTATLGGFIGGMLSDFFGRKKLVSLSLVVLSAVFLCLVFIDNPYILFALNVIRGLFTSFYLTISKALMADFTPQEKRFRAFSNRYMAANIGYAVGPIIGTFFGIAGNTGAFLITSMMYVGYFALMIAVIWKYNIQEASEVGQNISFRHSFNVLRKDKVLPYFIVGSILLVIVHGEMSVTLSQYLKTNIDEGIRLFGYMMSVNGITVILTQVFITRWSERFGLFERIAMGVALFAIGEIGFAFSHTWTGFIIAMVIFTFGEILVVPAEYAQIDEITPNGLRGMYYGAQSFTEVGNFIGPWLGGMVLLCFGGQTMFLTMACLAILSLVFFAQGRKIYLHQRVKELKQKVSAI